MSVIFAERHRVEGDVVVIDRNDLLDAMEAEMEAAIKWDESTTRMNALFRRVGSKVQVDSDLNCYWESYDWMQGLLLGVVRHGEFGPMVLFYRGRRVRLSSSPVPTPPPA